MTITCDVSQPFKEVCTMIAHTFQDAFSAQWIKDNLSNPTHDLILLRHLIPWQSIIDRLTPFYHTNKGRNANPCAWLSTNYTGIVQFPGSGILLEVGI